MVQAHSLIAAQPVIPDSIWCVAGGAAEDCGFLLDLNPQTFERSMTSNYYSSLYPAQAVFKRWVEDDAAANTSSVPTVRKLVFVNSTASLIALPGYVAYSGMNIYS